ncbi:MAG: hypothetical protein KBD78_07555 [Oligoflexales bacterium]|nr:hypothetical protein [Oligoflexales bacterium]
MSRFYQYCERNFLILLIFIIYTHNAEAQRVSVMAYNVENLFDTETDSKKDDFTFLPLSKKNNSEHKLNCKKMGSKFYQDECLTLDWSETVLEKKMTQLAKVILSVNSGKGADVLILEEVENIKILEKFNSTFLKSAGYKSVVLIEGQDQRGIDVGMLSRFPVAEEPILHDLKLIAREGKKHLTRGVLGVVFELPTKEKLQVFGVHFPSGRNPFYLREQAFIRLTEIAKNSAHDFVVAGGDFNVSAGEDSRIFRKLGSKDWFISHIVGCHECLGSSYYGRYNSWSFLDAIMHLKKARNLSVQKAQQWKMDAASIKVVDFEINKRSKVGEPLRFDAKKNEGASDHFPVYAEFSFSSNKNENSK